MVVTEGLTACVPPPAGSAYELPSLPLTATSVALVAVTVNMDEAPAIIAAGLAEMPLVGIAGAALNWVPPHAASSMSSKVQGVTMKRNLLNDRRVGDFVTASSFLSLAGTCRPGARCGPMSDHEAVTIHQFTPRSRASAELSVQRT